MGEIEKNLQTLAEEINEEHRAFRRAFRATYSSALRAGDLLNEAKGQTQHGSWGKWVEENCEFSMRTAQVYMRLANNREKVEELIASADPDSLTITGIRRELAEAPAELDEDKSVSDTHFINLPTPREEGRPLGAIEQLLQSPEGREGLAEANREYEAEGVYLKVRSKIHDLYWMVRHMPPEEASKREFAHHAAHLTRDVIVGSPQHHAIFQIEEAEGVRDWLDAYAKSLKDAQARLYEHL